MHLPSHAFNVVPRKLIYGNFQERPGLVSPGFTVVPRNIIEGNSSQRPGLVPPDHSLTQLHVAHRYRHTMLQVTYWLYILTLAHGAWAQGRSHPFEPDFSVWATLICCPGFQLTDLIGGGQTSAGLISGDQISGNQLDTRDLLSGIISAGCECNGKTAGSQGECRTSYKGALFCYVDNAPGDGCRDAEWSSRSKSYWSHRACRNVRASSTDTSPRIFQLNNNDEIECREDKDCPDEYTDVSARKHFSYRCGGSGHSEVCVETPGDLCGSREGSRDRECREMGDFCRRNPRHGDCTLRPAFFGRPVQYSRGQVGQSYL